MLAAYDKMRRADVGSRTLAIDLLNRTLLTDFLPVQGLRGLGLYMIDRIGPLRRAVDARRRRARRRAAAADARGSALACVIPGARSATGAESKLDSRVRSMRTGFACQHG